MVRKLRAVASLGFLTAELLINAIAAALFLHRRVESRHVSLSAPSLLQMPNELPSLQLCVPEFSFLYELLSI